MVVIPQEILGRELEGQCNRKCDSVSGASPHLVQVGDVVWFILYLCLYCCKFGWCPHLNLASEICVFWEVAEVEVYFGRGCVKDVVWWSVYQVGMR